jgi:hypothetical protein
MPIGDGDRETVHKVVGLLRDAALGLSEWLKEVREEHGIGPALVLAYTAHGALMAALTLAEQAEAALGDALTFEVEGE